MGTKPENYARNVIAIVAPMDSPKKGNPSDDFKRIFIGINMDDILVYLVDRTCEILEAVDITKGSAERVLEDLNTKCQKLREALIQSTTLNTPEDATFKQKNLYCMALSMVLQKYAGALTINLGGANTAINAVDIDIAADSFCDKKNPIRSLTLLFHAYESGLLTDVELKQFLASQLSGVVKAGKDLMEALVQVGTAAMEGPKQPTTADIGMNVANLCEISYAILENPVPGKPLELAKIPFANLSGDQVLQGTLTCTKDGSELREFSIGAYSVPCRFWVALKESIFLLLRGIINRYDDLSDRLPRLHYLRDHLEDCFGSFQDGATNAFRLALYEMIALCEREVFGHVNESTTLRIRELTASLSCGNIDLTVHFPEESYEKFLRHLIECPSDIDCYGVGTITDVVHRLQDKEANPLLFNVPWLAQFFHDTEAWMAGVCGY